METVENNAEHNETIIQLIKRILELNPGDRLDLLTQLEHFPGKDLSLGDRDGARRLYNQTITFSTQDGEFTAICKDISDGGIFVQTEDVFHVGQLVTLEIPYSHGEKSITVPAEIVRVSADGIGLRFLKKESAAHE